MLYVSTRGGCAPMAFTDAVLAGLATDGGLLLPERFPTVDQLADWRELPFVEIARRVFRLYADDIAPEHLDAALTGAFATFEHPEVVPLRDFGDFQLLELFHGPTLSFKDVALQVLGRLFEHVLAARGGRLNILGATSGDTGSAAIQGVRGRSNIGMFMLYPNERVSPLQELQMTTVLDANVHCLAIDGSFDDCQNIVKALFGDLAFKRRHALGAVNSMNWARVLAQMAYYVHAALRCRNGAVFAVPTGNFGNLFAGIAARAMGAAINGFVLATNDNDILARFFQTGVYRHGPVRRTISPSMDIQIASNFERFLFLRLGRDAQRVKAFMAAFREHGEARLPVTEIGDAGIRATSIDTATTLRTIRAVYEAHGYIVDPHTAVGIAAARHLGSAENGGDAPICMAAAHPAKFPDAVREAIGTTAHHPTLAGLNASATRRAVLPAQVEAVKRFVADHAL